MTDFEPREYMSSFGEKSWTGLKQYEMEIVCVFEAFQITTVTIETQWKDFIATLQCNLLGELHRACSKTIQVKVCKPEIVCL